MSLPFREGRLRPRFAALYPDLTPGAWVPACTLKEFVLERGLYQRRVSRPGEDRMTGSATCLPEVLYFSVPRARHSRLSASAIADGMGISR
jgi:hypothetical protein